ncbi:MAG TPA: acetylglutamate kinase [Fimbriiglobus sp.]|nr:acetylglutamate kinase [Fimbriiglobus sp.]
MTSPSSPPEVLLRATCRARALRGQALVVKLGGSAMEDPAATRGTLESVVALQTLGVRLVLVHGGGKPIDRAMAAAGLEPRKVAGRRYTDDATLKIVVEVLRDGINTQIVTRLRELGGKAAGLPNVLVGQQLELPGDDGRPIDLGRVGRPTQVDVELIGSYLDGQFVPVIPSLALEPFGGGWLNVNADTAASAVAGALKAEACYFLTDTPGVLRDVNDPASLIRRLTRAECEHLIRDGMIAGGMIPKVEACFEALDAGAGRAVILDGRKPHALLGEFVSENLTGTVIVN